MGLGSRDLCLERLAAKGAEGTSQPYYRWGSPGRAGPVVFQAVPEYFAAVQSSTLHCTKRRPPRINKVGLLSLHEDSIKVIKGWK